MKKIASTNLTGENIKLNNEEERTKAQIVLEKAKKLKRKVRVLPAGMSGEQYKILLVKEKKKI